MDVNNFLGVAMVATALALIVGCAAVPSTISTIIVDRLQMVSAGHTGCLPDANEISNVKMNLDGSGLWNATCTGRTYLCSAVGSVGDSESFSCAPVAQ